MSVPALRRETEEAESYQFACPRCWAMRTVTLTPGAKRPVCECGSVLFAVAEAQPEEAEDLSLDHPHSQADCQFCAARQTPMQHRLWCAIYFLRNCNCGYGLRP